jgi:hypothetical protein
MPAECGAPFASNPAREIVGRVKARPNNQHLLSRRPSLKPCACAADAAVAHGGDENVCSHAETLRLGELDHNQMGAHDIGKRISEAECGYRQLLPRLRVVLSTRRLRRCCRDAPCGRCPAQCPSGTREQAPHTWQGCVQATIGAVNVAEDPRCSATRRDAGLPRTSPRLVPRQCRSSARPPQ